MKKEGCILKVDSLTKSYYNGKNSKKSLSSVSFTLDEGLYGLLGPNGAGKSTMMNIITGNLAPSSGSIFWNGKNILKNNKQFRKILGYMPQQQNLYDSFTGRQFLLYLAALKEIPRKNMADEIERTAALVHLSDNLNKTLSGYSGGMKQRLLAAAAMIGNPKVLILDEPTAGLDPKERVRLREVLQTLSRDCIVIVATHVVSDVESVAKEILLLKEGQLVDKDSPHELIKKYAPNGNLEDVYLAVFGEDDI